MTGTAVIVIVIVAVVVIAALVIVAVVAASSSGSGNTVPTTDADTSTPVPTTGLPRLRAPISADEIQIPDAAAILETLSPTHPRIYLSSDSVEELRAKVEIDPDFAALYEQIVQRADALLDEPAAIYDKPDGYRLLSISRQTHDRMTDLGIVWLLGGEERHAERAWIELAAVSAFEDWNPIHFLDVAEMAHAVAVGYDWLYDHWTSDQRELLEEALSERALIPAREVYNGESSFAVGWWADATHNWNQVVNGGLSIAAVAVGDVEPDLAGSVLHDALTRLPGAMAHYGPDGGWFEGPTYWSYATMFNVYALAALESALHTDFDLARVAGFAQAGDFPIHMTGPTGRSFNFGDAGDEPNPSSAALLWLADRFGRPDFAMRHDPAGSPTAADLIWAGAPTGETATPATMWVFEGIPVAVMRSSWGDPDAVWVAFKGGNNSWPHNQLDLGTFVVDADGVRWAVDLGPDDYNLPGYFATGEGGLRWTYYRNRAEGHNTLVIGRPGPEDQPVSATAPLMASAESGRGGWAVMDLTAGYPAAQQVHRGVALDGDTVLVQDEIVGAGGEDILWFLHTQAETEPSSDGGSVVLTQNGRSLLVELMSPTSSVFEVLPAEPLADSPRPEGQGDNTGVRKLAIRLRGGSGTTTIAVAMTPGTESSRPELTPLTPLTDW